MKLDTANRSFLVIVAVALVGYGLIGAAACGILGVLAYRVAAHGLSGLTSGGHDLRPALLFLVLVGTGMVFGVLSLRKQLLATEDLDRHVRSRRVGTSVHLLEAALRGRLDGRVVEVDEPEPFSFTYGLVRPRVVVSRALVRRATSDELDAVLTHERYHVRNLDPVKLVLVRALPSAFFFLPVLRDLRTRYLAGRELAADQRTLSLQGQAALAGALYKVVAGPDWAELGPAAALGGPDFLEARITQIETGSEPSISGPTWSSAVLTAVGLGALVWSVVVSGLAGSFSMMSGMGSMGSMRSDSSLGFIGMALSLVFLGWVAWEILRAIGRRRSSI